MLRTEGNLVTEDLVVFDRMSDPFGSQPMNFFDNDEDYDDFDDEDYEDFDDEDYDEYDEDEDEDEDC
jgi:hypothetical protein